MNSLKDAAMMDILSTELEMKVAQRTKNKTLIENTRIDFNVAKQKATALVSLSNLLNDIMPSLSSDVKNKIKSACNEYQQASFTKLNAAKTLDLETSVANLFGFMGKCKKSKRRTTKKTKK